MRRREFIGGVGAYGALGARRARGQQLDQVRRIGVLMGSAPTDLGKTYLATFVQRLGQLGWTEGRNARVEVRWWTGGSEEMRPIAAQLLSLPPDVVMVFSNLALALFKPLTKNVPVVFVGVGDPVGDGFVTSLSHPGGNIMGFAGTDGPIGGKWLEVLKETAPLLTRVMMIYHPETPIHQAFWRSLAEAAPRFGVEATALGVHDAGEIQRGILAFAVGENRGVIVAPHAITWAHEELIVALTIRHRLPTHFATDASVAAGGLVCYGHDFQDSFRKTAEYVDRILRGEKPENLPVQMPTKFKLTLNLKTAKAIGLTVPALLLARADEVIE